MSSNKHVLVQVLLTVLLTLGFPSTAFSLGETKMLRVPAPVPVVLAAPQHGEVVTRLVCCLAHHSLWS